MAASLFFSCVEKTFPPDPGYMKASYFPENKIIQHTYMLGTVSWQDHKHEYIPLNSPVLAHLK